MLFILWEEGVPFIFSMQVKMAHFPPVIEKNVAFVWPSEFFLFTFTAEIQNHRNQLDKKL